MRQLLFISILLLGSISCKKDKIEDAKIDCGCNSKTEKVINDVPASINEFGGIYIFEKFHSTMTSVPNRLNPWTSL